MQPLKKRRSSGSSSNMERSSDSADTAEPPRKFSGGKDGDKQRQEEKRKRKAHEKAASKKPARKGASVRGWVCVCLCVADVFSLCACPCCVCCVSLCAALETIPPLPLDKVEGQNPPTRQEGNKPQADPKSAVPTKFGSRRSKRASMPAACAVLLLHFRISEFTKCPVAVGNGSGRAWWHATYPPAVPTGMRRPLVCVR